MTIASGFRQQVLNQCHRMTKSTATLPLGECGYILYDTGVTIAANAQPY